MNFLYSFCSEFSEKHKGSRRYGIPHLLHVGLLVGDTMIRLDIQRKENRVKFSRFRRDYSVPQHSKTLEQR